MLIVALSLGVGCANAQQKVKEADVPTAVKESFKKNFPGAKVEKWENVLFKNETHKATLNILYTAWWLKTKMSKELKEFGLTHEQYNVLRIL